MHHLSSWRSKTFLLLLAVYLPSSVCAEELAIKDTAGNVRSVSEVTGNGTVEFTLVENGKPADGIEIILTSDSGESFTQVAAGGNAVFSELPPGVYTVASSSPSVTFTSVSITSSSLAGGGSLAAGSMASAGGVSAGAIAIGGAIVVGGSAAAIAISEDSKDSDDPSLSPSS